MISEAHEAAVVAQLRREENKRKLALLPELMEAAKEVLAFTSWGESISYQHRSRLGAAIEAMKGDKP